MTRAEPQRLGPDNMTCHHGVRHCPVQWWRGEVECPPCYEETWESGRVITIIGVLFLLIMLFTPLVLMLCGVFWR